jgi:hypothetical protein
MINIGIGVSWAKSLYSVANNIIANFRARVLSYPNSIFEAGPCLDETLEELNAVGLLDDASLIVTPNAYNEGVLYDVIPNTPLGDMDVVRATTATRVNSSGLIEVVPRNLLLNSNTFNGSGWNMGGVTLTANQPDVYGGNNAWLVQFENTISSSYLFQTIPNQLNAASMWIKPTTGSIGKNVMFGIQLSVGNGNPFLLNEGWQKLTNSNTAQYFILSNFCSNFATSFYICFAQAEQGSTATEYFPTTTRLNIPRIDYTNGSCPSLLVEPQRTNLLTRSEEFNDSSWAVNATITANTAISPDGTQDADTILGTGFIGKNILQSGIHTFSVFAKAGTSNEIRLNVFDGTTDRGVYYNLSNGTITSSYGTIISSNIVSYGNGWYRIIITTNNATRSYVQIHRDSAQTCFIYGAQLELGSYPTSYIPTVASTVTRNADVISKTGISSLIGQTEGTMFWEFTNPIATGTNDYFNLSDGSADNWILVGIDSSGFIFYINAGGVNQVNITSPLTVGTHKIAMSYKNNDVVCYVNGTQVGTDTNVTIPATSKINLSMANMADAKTTSNYTKLAAIWKTKLTNEQLALLTGDLYDSYNEMANNLNYILQ